MKPLTSFTRRLSMEPYAYLIAFSSSYCTSPSTVTLTYLMSMFKAGQLYAGEQKVAVVSFDKSELRADVADFDAGQGFVGFCVSDRDHKRLDSDVFAPDLGLGVDHGVR